MPLPQIRARHLVRAERRGSSGPIEVEADDGGRWLVKLRGAAQGPGYVAFLWKRLTAPRPFAIA